MSNFKAMAKITAPQADGLSNPLTKKKAPAEARGF
jgi:hypothetical protein